ncbi:MAG: undecaprenyl/decaprenyl-phosphate alpha-N-acetylglucosaminyl 1-phosphate transferase [Phycisphaerae bacterium]|nr:undecaprenyl/decaprenyl-phosphate alpha-N-acetylglucosaminyl 1-phosphate transferase [Phycisphaerae bacterium]
MVWPCLALIVLSFALALPGAWAARALGRRARAFDGPGVSGQVKAAARSVPNTGGIAVFWAITLPLVAAIALLRWLPDDVWSRWLPVAVPHLAGARSVSGEGIALLAALAVLHAVGVLDDRRPLRAGLKLVVMLAVAGALVAATDSRLLTLLDSRLGPRPIGISVSFVLTVVWLIVVTNAMNFMDNMDGLSAGVAAIAATSFLAAALLAGQWFIASCLALLVGATLGFLLFNFPFRRPATLFMGDSGSLVLGFLLAFLTVRTTYIPAARTDGPVHWYAVLMPLVTLAVPLYDFVSVCIIRHRQGRSPLLGDLQHFSHRLVRRGLSPRNAVLVIYGITAITSITGVSLASLNGWQAALAGLQTALVLAVLALYESVGPPASDPALRPKP